MPWCINFLLRGKLYYRLKKNNIQAVAQDTVATKGTFIYYVYIFKTNE